MLEKDRNLKGRTVLITGGSRGIGRATAIAFAEMGARVAINFVQDHQAASRTIDELPNSEQHIAIRADVSIPASAEQLVQQVIKEFDQLDILVNNAGVYIEHPVDESTYEQWQKAWHKTMSINLFGASNLSFCTAQQMIRQGGGRMVNVSSRGAFRGEPNHPAYGASKAALNQMSQSMAQALAKYNIFVGVVAPGFVETDMAKSVLESPIGASIKNESPFRRVAQPDEVAKAIVFLASEAPMFMSGAILDVNGASYLRS